MRYEASILPFAVISSLVGVWFYGLPGAAIGSVLATFVAYTLFLKRLSKVVSVPIAKLQDWKNLERVGSLRARRTFFGRLAETIDPNRCDSRACRSFGALCYYFVCDGVLSNACLDAKRIGSIRISLLV
jgi:hypothetical protein